MACFLVPMGEAIVTTVVQKVTERREKKVNRTEGTKKTGLTWSRRLSWLNKMLWGGTVLLGLEHLWHGEVILSPPFFSAMQTPANIAPMLREVATVGVAMALFVTVIWAILILVVELKSKSLNEIGIKSGRGGK
jgi:hypothetical protein